MTQDAGHRLQVAGSKVKSQLCGRRSNEWTNACQISFYKNNAFRGRREVGEKGSRGEGK
jgi:hypothetical protein